MKSLKALTTLFDSLATTEKDQFDSWAENGELEWSGEKISVTDNSLLLWRQRYLAVFSFENFTGDPDQLFLKMMTWLENSERDADELGPPEFDVEKVDDHTFDVEIKIWFEDNIYGTTNNDEYEIIEKPEITTAEEIGNVTSGIDCQ